MGLFQSLLSFKYYSLLESAHAHIDPSINTICQSVVLPCSPQWTSQISNEAVAMHQARNPSGQFCFPALSSPRVSCLRIGLFAFYVLYTSFVRFNIFIAHAEVDLIRSSSVCMMRFSCCAIFVFFGSTVLK